MQLGVPVSYSEILQASWSDAFRMTALFLIGMEEIVCNGHARTWPLHLCWLIPRGNGQVVDVRAASWRLVPHLETRHEVKNVRRREATAGAVNREHGLAADIVEIDVLHDGASPVRKIEKIDARLVG